MTKYLISFDDRAMTFPEGELPAVTQAGAGRRPGSHGRRCVGVQRRVEGA